MKKFIIILSFLSSILTVAHAEDDKNKSFDDSLNKTQDLLRSKEQRSGALKETDAAKKVDERVKQLAPDAKTEQEYYELAADIMNNYRDAKDEEAMKKSIDDGGRDPSAFLNGLTPEQKAKVKALSEKLSPSGGQTNP